MLEPPGTLCCPLLGALSPLILAFSTYVSVFPSRLWAENISVSSVLGTGKILHKQAIELLVTLSNRSQIREKFGQDTDMMEKQVSLGKWAVWVGKRRAGLLRSTLGCRRGNAAGNAAFRGAEVPAGPRLPSSCQVWSSGAPCG